MSPKVLDAEGREIRVGDRVLHDGDESPGRVKEIDLMGALVIWDRSSRYHPATDSHFADPPRTRRCPDLQLLDDREESPNEH